MLSLLFTLIMYAVQLPDVSTVDCQRTSISRVVETSEPTPIVQAQEDEIAISWYRYESQLTGKTSIIVLYKCDDKEASNGLQKGKER